MATTGISNDDGPTRPCTRCDGTQHFSESETQVSMGTQTRSMWTCSSCGLAEGQVSISGSHSPGENRVPND